MAAIDKKKNKKGKGVKTMSLAAFHAEDSVGSTSAHRYPSTSWADNTEDLDRKGSPPWHKEDKTCCAAPINRSVLPTAPRSTRELDIDRSRLPLSPPYTAFLGNLPYDVSEHSIKEFFHGLAIGEVRLPREPINPERLKGFGYAEFDDEESLLKALDLNEENLGNRRIRVDIASDKERDSGHMGRRDQIGRMSDMGPDMTASDWRARPTTGDNVNDGPPKRDDAFGERSHDRYDPKWDNAGRDRRDRNDNRGGFDSRSGVGCRAFGNGYRRNYDDKPSYDRYGNQDHYSADREDRYERRDDRREERPALQRPKLNLKPCSILKEEEQGGGGDALSPSSGTRASSIFGGAKPVDTAAREREMEERLKKEQERLQPEDGGRRPDRKPRDRDHPNWRNEDPAGRAERSHTGNESTRPGSSSGRGLQCRDSECSVKNEEVFSDPSSPGSSPCPPSNTSSKEPPKGMPAPPPKWNAWAKRSAVGAKSSDGHGQPPSSAPPKFSSSSTVERGSGKEVQLSQ